MLPGCLSVASVASPDCFERAEWQLSLPEAAAIPDLVGRQGFLVGERIYVAGGNVYSNTPLTHAYVVAVEAGTGALLWTWVSGPDVAPGGTARPVLFAQDVVVALLATPIPDSEHAGAVGIDAASGKELWTRPGHPEEWYDVVDGVLVLQRGGGFVRLDERTGEPMPGATVPERKPAYPVAPPTGEEDATRLYYADWSGDVVALDAATKEELWRVHVGLSKTWTKNMGGFVLGPEFKPVGVQVRDQGILVQRSNATWFGADRYQHLRLLDKETGETKWKTGRVYGGILRDPGDTIVLDVDPPIGQEHLVGLDAETGDALWRCKLTGSTHPLLILAEGYDPDRPLYLADDDRIGRLGFGESSGQEPGARSP